MLDSLIPKSANAVKEWTMHSTISLMQVVDKTWSEANCQGPPRCSVALLLAPAYLDVFTKDQCEDILNAVFTFTDQSGRRL